MIVFHDRADAGRRLAEVPTGFTGDEVVVLGLQQPAIFEAVCQWYEGFSQTRDEEVIELLARKPFEEVAGGRN